MLRKRLMVKIWVALLFHLPFFVFPLFGKGTPAKAPIAVVQATTACAAADRSYAASRAKWTQQSLKTGGVKADLIGDAGLAKELAGRRLVYLVTCQTPSAAQLAALESFRQRGGKIAVLQSYSPDLARFMRHSAPAKAVRGPVSLVAAAGGWWSSNLFAAEVSETDKIRLLVGMADVGLGTRYGAAWEAKLRAKAAAVRAKALAQTPRPGEIHAVWDHSGEGLYPGDWPRTMRFLKANGVTDLFVNVAGAGFAHYASRVLPASDTYRQRGDQLAACLAAARGTGIRVHAWVLCFNATRGSTARLAQLAQRGWRLKDKAGNLTAYLDPSNADVRWHLLMALEEAAAKYPVAGIHLDFVRWYEKAAGKPVEPSKAVDGFVESVRTRLRVKHPRMWLTAAVLPSYPSCVRSVGQDWERWIARGLVDYIVPMDYVEKPKAFRDLLARQARTPVQARHVIAGLGVTANESRLGAGQVIDQIVTARRAGVAGVSLFELNATLAEEVLPFLRLGLFR